MHVHGVAFADVSHESDQRRKDVNDSGRNTGTGPFELHHGVVVGAGRVEVVHGRDDGSDDYRLEDDGHQTQQPQGEEQIIQSPNTARLHHFGI